MEKEKNNKYKVTNKGKDVRKFRDQFFGKDIFVGPKKSVYTDHPPENTVGIWKVENIEKLEKKRNQLNPKEVLKMENKIENDSSSNR